jgi:hypothetical protein
MSDQSEHNSSLGVVDLAPGVLPQWFHSVDRAIEWADQKGRKGTLSELIEVREYLESQQKKQELVKFDNQLPTMNMKRLLNYCLGRVEENDEVEWSKMGFVSTTFTQCKAFIGKLKARSDSS